MRKGPIFIPGGAVEPPFYVGREDITKQIVSDLEYLAQNILLLAPRRFGKTSLIANVRKKLLKTAVIPLSINCRRITNYEDLFELFSEAIIKEYEKRIDPKARLLSKWKRIMQEKITKAFDRLEEIGGEIAILGKFYLRFRDKELKGENLLGPLFNFIGEFAGNKGLKLVFLLDEFQELSSFNNKIFQALKVFMDENKNIRFLFSGSSIDLLNRIFLAPISPLYLMTAKYELNALKYKDVESLLNKRFAIFGMSIDPEVIQIIFEETSGIPFYVQKLGLLCYDLLLIQKKKIVDKEVVNIALDKMLDEFDGEFEQRWLEKFSDLQRGVCKAIAKLKKASSKQIAKTLNKQPSDISSTLKRLLQYMELDKTSDSNYYLRDKVFERWIVDKL